MSDNDQYALTHSKRGQFVIINNENFKSGQASRVGTDHDAKKLEETFGQFGFETKTFKDQDAHAIYNTIEELGSKDHSNYDCVGVAILTHGSVNSDEAIYGSDGKSVDLTKLFKPLMNCQSLAGKPKLIYIMAGPLSNECNGMMREECFDGFELPVILPETADFSYYYALNIPAGTKDWNFQEKGSIFIQELCDTMSECSTRSMEFERVKMRVNSRIAEILEMVPDSNSTLTKKLVLTQTNELELCVQKSLKE